MIVQPKKENCDIKFSDLVSNCFKRKKFFFQKHNYNSLKHPSHSTHIKIFLYFCLWYSIRLHISPSQSHFAEVGTTQENKIHGSTGNHGCSYQGMYEVTNEGEDLRIRKSVYQNTSICQFPETSIHKSYQQRLTF